LIQSTLLYIPRVSATHTDLKLRSSTWALFTEGTLRRSNKRRYDYLSTCRAFQLISLLDLTKILYITDLQDHSVEIIFMSSTITVAAAAEPSEPQRLLYIPPSLTLTFLQFSQGLYLHISIHSKNRDNTISLDWYLYGN
jgi:hypothetical protein